MVHNFDTENAKKYGILEAVLISNFEFWIAKNQANGTNFFDEKYWVYNSARALTELFPYASEQQIKRALQHLKENNVLITGNYNKSSYDKTLWYTFSDEYLSIVQSKTIDSSNLTNRETDIDQPIPDNKTDNIITPLISPQGETPVEDKKIHFAEFVAMTNAEHEKLCSTYGKEFTDQCIEVLDNYKGSKGKKYKNDYRAILSWVVDRVKQNNSFNDRRKSKEQAEIDAFMEKTAREWGME